MEMQSRFDAPKETFFNSELYAKHVNEKAEAIINRKEEFIHGKLDEHLSKFHKWLVFSFNLNWLVMKYVAWKNDIEVLEYANDNMCVGIRIKGETYWTTISI